MSQPPTIDPSQKGLPSWLLFAFLMIGPPTVFVAFVRTLTPNPLLIASLVVGYEILLFIARFTGRVWQPIEEMLVKHTTQWITTRVQASAFHYHRHYYEYLVYEHQVFDVKGLSTRTAHDLELEQVFVDLHINSIPSHKASADPVPPPRQIEGKHSIIWDYLSSPSSANPHLVILGAPGSGKTTLLKHLALTLAKPKKYPHHPHMHHTFPILLFLRDHVSTIIDQSDFSLANALQNHIQRKWQQNISSTWIERHLTRGNCLVLLDGLDEVADLSARQHVVAWVQRQIQAYGYRGHNRFVLTSRPYGYRDNPLEGVTTLDTQPFAPEQVELFIQHWYLANELKSWGKEDPGVHLRAREGAQDLLRRLRHVPALLALAVNPLLLTMIATVHRYRSSLPGKRVALYAEICEVFLGKRSEARGIAQELSPAQKQRVLQPLAYFMMQQGKRDITTEEVQQIITSPLALVNTQIQPTDFLSIIQNTSGLLLERNLGSYGFAHLTFQEYLAAVHIKEKGLHQDLTTQIENSWWHETIRLYCAQADATSLIKACLKGNPPTIAALTLAFECDEEKLEIQPDAQAQLNALLSTGVEDLNSERRRIVAEALLTRRLRQMTHLSKETYVSTSLVTCAEYQLFLNEQREQNKWYQPDHWQRTEFVLGEGRRPILGVRQADAHFFCEWLTQRDVGGWIYRLPTRMDQINTLDTLGEDTGYWMNEGYFNWARGKPSASLKNLIDDLFIRAYDEARDLARARANGHARARARALDRARAFARVLVDVRALALDLADVHGRALALARALDEARDLANDDVRALANALVRDLALVHTRSFDRVHTLDRAHARARALANARALADDLTLADDRPLANARALADDLTLANARVLADDLYFTLYLFVERMGGGLPAFEGILLIKEKKESLSLSEMVW